MRNFLVIVGLSGLNVVGDWLIKSATTLNGPERTHLVVIGYAAYVVSWPAWYFALKSLGLTQVAVLYALATLVLRVFLDVAWLGHRLNDREIAGIMVAIGAVVLLTLES